MRIVSFNVNGLRSIAEYYKVCTINSKEQQNSGSFGEFLESFDAEIICFQETKINDSSKLDYSLEFPSFHNEKKKAFNSYFCFPKKPKKIGHAGVVTFSRFVPTFLTDSFVNCRVLIDKFGLVRLKKLEEEGRFICIGFGSKIVILNVYFPNDSYDYNEVDNSFRNDFYNVISEWCQSLKGDFEIVILLGDFNSTYTPFHHCDYEMRARQLDVTSEDIKEYISTGIVSTSEFKVDLLKTFFNEEKPMRRWFCKWFIEHEQSDSFQLIDAFEYLHSKEPKRYTCWNTKLNARASNHGTRIDHIFIFTPKTNLQDLVLECDQMNDFMGSDHCPVWVELNIEDLTEGIANIPKQQKLTNFFTSNIKSESEQPKNLNIGSVQNYDIKNNNTKKLKTISIKDYFPPKTLNDVKLRETKISNIKLEREEDGIKSHEFKDDEVKLVEAHKNWESLFEAKKRENGKIPLCREHHLPCILKQTKKVGPNQGRWFYMCSVNVPNQCSHFEWRLGR